MRTSTGPASASMRAIRPETCDGSARSAGNAVAPVSPATLTRASDWRATAVTRAPRSARFDTTARPMPRDAPVTTQWAPSIERASERIRCPCSCADLLTVQVSRETEEPSRVQLHDLVDFVVGHVRQDLSSTLPALGPVGVGVGVVALPRNPVDADLMSILQPSDVVD